MELIATPEGGFTAEVAGPAGAPLVLLLHGFPQTRHTWREQGRHPERVKSLTILSRPHPAAFRKAFKEDASDQQKRSRHHKAFHDPNTATFLLEDDARRLRQTLADDKVPESSIAEYLSVLSDPAALEAALAWYRAAGALADMETSPVMVPTLYMWGDHDSSVGRSAAEWTAEHVLGVYQLAVISGGGHFLTDQAPALVTRLMLDHISRAS